jgi:hypothetical protein
VDPSDQKQAALLADARAKAAAGDHAYSFAACSDAIKLRPGTSLAVDAALVCARERIALGERSEAAADLGKLISSLPATDPRRAQAEEILKGIAPPSL